MTSRMPPWERVARGLDKRMADHWESRWGYRRSVIILWLWTILLAGAALALIAVPLVTGQVSLWTCAASLVVAVWALAFLYYRYR